jgi:hypothetical protein
MVFFQNKTWLNQIYIIIINEYGEYFMKNAWKQKVFVFLALLIMAVTALTGCEFGKDEEERVKDLEFTVVTEAEIPQELKQIIADKQQSPFKLTYTDDKNLFIVIGYGKQNSGGYSIAVDDLYLTDNSIVIDTDLIGPEKGENTGNESSYPFIVVKTELSELPVVFQ